MSLYAVRNQYESGQVSWSGSYKSFEEAVASADRSIELNAVESDVYKGGLITAGCRGERPLYRAKTGELLSAAAQQKPRRRPSALAERREAQPA